MLASAGQQARLTEAIRKLNVAAPQQHVVAGPRCKKLFSYSVPGVRISRKRYNQIRSLL